MSLRRSDGLRDEADSDAYLRLIELALGNQLAHREILKAQHNEDIVRQGCYQGGLDRAGIFAKRNGHTGL
ncbi:MAG TPA: hypothetical protein VMB75_07795 [Rhodocyclaceae bacterium]|nr:hypothetical protein [Rhodocyclaceae bacterium]